MVCRGESDVVFSSSCNQTSVEQTARKVQLTKNIFKSENNPGYIIPRVHPLQEKRPLLNTQDSTSSNINYPQFLKEHGNETKRKNWCRVLTVFLVLFLILSLLSIGYMVMSFDFKKRNASLSAIVAENDTVILATVPLKETSAITIKEVVFQGDTAHTGYAVIVPKDKIKVKQRKGTKSFNGMSLDKIPIVNVPFVYLLEQSVLEFEICIGNSPTEVNSSLYIFDEFNQYNNYLLSDIVTSATFRKVITIGGRNKSICSSINYTTTEDSYYFAVLIAPQEGIQISYTLIASEKVLDIREYLNGYPACFLKANEDCKLLTSDLNKSSSLELSLLVFMEPNYDFYSKLTHIEISVSSYKHLPSTLPAVFCGITVTLTVFVFLVVLGTVFRSYWMSKKRSSK